MESSNTPELTADVTTETASPVESSVETKVEPKDVQVSVPEKAQTLKEAILSRKGKEVPEAPAASKETPAPAVVADPAAPVVPEAPKYEPNYKFKAFGKEKEIPDAFRSIIKDPESEKQVREVFTRAEAFDDMKGRYEATTREHQSVLNEFTALDKDVKRVTGFLNKRDLDNFFQTCRLSDAEIIQYLQNKAQYMTDPALKQQYQQQVQQRADYFSQQEQFEHVQNNYSNLAVQNRTMQLDGLMSRPDVSNVASAWDSKMGEIGAFRNLVIQEASNHYHLYKQDLPAEQAVQLALNKFGKLVAQVQAPQAPAMAPQAPAATLEMSAPQAPAAPVVQAKPVIPTIQGKGTSPVKQAPKSLDDLRRMGKEAARAEGLY